MALLSHLYGIYSLNINYYTPIRNVCNDPML